jgi:hypothetical protein
MNSFAVGLGTTGAPFANRRRQERTFFLHFGLNAVNESTAPRRAFAFHSLRTETRCAKWPLPRSPAFLAFKSSLLRLERDEDYIVFAEVELLFEFSVAANRNGADFRGCAAVFGFDLRHLSLGQLRG